MANLTPRWENKDPVWVQHAARLTELYAGRVLTWRGKTQTIEEWAMQYDIHKHTMYSRLDKYKKGEYHINQLFRPNAAKAWNDVMTTNRPLRANSTSTQTMVYRYTTSTGSF